MTVNTAAGSKLFMGTTAEVDESTVNNAIADFAADTYVEVGEVEDMGEIGDEASEVTFTALANRRVRKFKGSYNSGTSTIVVGDDPTDVGQVALINGLATDFDYNFKMVLSDQLTISGEPTIQYFRAKVMSKRRNVGNVENIVRRTFALGVNSPIYEIAAS